MYNRWSWDCKCKLNWIWQSYWSDTWACYSMQKNLQLTLISPHLSYTISDRRWIRLLYDNATVKHLYLSIHIITPIRNFLFHNKDMQKIFEKFQKADFYKTLMFLWHLKMQSNLFHILNLFYLHYKATFSCFYKLEI